MGLIRGLNPDKERTHILEEDRENETEDQVRWIYKLLDCRDAAKTQDALVQMIGQRARRNMPEQETRTQILSGTQELNTLVAGIVRVENFKDEETGEPILYPAGSNDDPRVVKERKAWWTWVRPRWRTELARVIQNENEPTDEEKKALPSPSGSTSPGT